MHLGEDRPRLCQQLVQLEVDGNLTALHTLYDWETPNTLVKTERAIWIGLQGVRIPRQAIGWGRDLLPPDNAPGGQAGAQGGEDEQEEAAQEVQLPEYKGWSQGAGRPGNGDGSSTTAQRGGCTGARPKTRGAASSQVVPSARGRASRGDRPRRPYQEPGPPARTQSRFGNARPQASGRTRSGLRMVPPPRRRPSPSPPPAQGRRSWDWTRPARRGQGPRGAGGRRPPYRSPSPDPGRAQNPLQLVRPGDNPMQRLAMMMAVMILGMSPAHGCSVGADPRSLEIGGQVEMMPLLPMWYSDCAAHVCTFSSSAANL